ncbi:MAG: aminoacyl--tRNA ligase-related protein [Candidatus Woesebacteria bacterium]|nr:aminoacyl--tRNA ligase-related protein [Candidatus Woesebacteria bacterium]
MLQSQLFPKTKKEAPKDAESVNHKLLVRAGFIDQLMAGSWTLLPLGWRVITKINQIIREEMNAIGGHEMLMPLLHPKAIWNETGRWDKANEIMYKLKDIHDKEYVLSFTHEEIVMDLLRKNINSYKDLPVSIYHFSTKFRNELRAKNGILRGREFMMKDLYSAHASEEDLIEYYEKVKEAYSKIFTRLGFSFKITKASGGVFTDKFTHEFQVLSEAGEDTIYWKEGDKKAVNEEILEGNKKDYKSAKAIEVGNIFPLGTWYAEKMGMNFTDADGARKPVWFGSYGIGPTRVMGTWVEVSHDDKGIIWNKEISPFDVHLIGLNGKGEDVYKRSLEIYKKLLENKIDVLFDDRDIGAGEKFADSDLIGIPVRLVVSNKTGDKIEYKERTSKESKLLILEEIIKKLR